MRARNPIALALTAAVALAAAGCGGGDNGQKPSLPPPGDAGTSRPDVGAPSGRVVVNIQAPGEGSQLNTNSPINISSTIEVVDGTDFIDPASVKTTLVLVNSTAVVSQGTLVGPVGSNTYRGLLSTVGLKQGNYILTVSATTSAGVSGEAHVGISIDNGPQLIVISPVPGGHYKGGIIVQVVADPGAYGPLMDLKGSAGGLPINLQSTGPENQYRAIVDFNDQMPPLKGEQLFVVSATNSMGTRTEIRFIIIVDEDGPLITGTVPPAGTVLPAVVRIGAFIRDDAGINESSVQVIIGDKLGNEYRLALRRDGNGFYSNLFDTHTFPKCKIEPTEPCIIFPTLSFRAADLLGNERIYSYQVAVDDIPPIADLTPPPIRDSKVAMGALRCSWLFDPLANNTRAGDMPDDLCMVGQVFDLRARIEDTGNDAVDIKLIPIAGVDPAETAVYVLDDVSRPLVVDTDADGYCDAVNPKLQPTTTPPTDPRQVLKVRFAPIAKRGNSDFTPDPSVPQVPITRPFTGGIPVGWSDLECFRGVDENPPVPLCPGNQPTIAITYAGMQPALWSLEPIEDANEGYCFGPPFDTLANNVGQGWKCIAVVTKDLNGNASTSPPIRVYVDYDYGGNLGVPFCASPPANAGPPPSCTGVYDRTNDTVTAGPCKTRKFLTSHPQPEICYQGECL